MSKEIKVALKKARAMFKENKYEDVVKECKMILYMDKNNYGALMLLAAAMIEIEEYKLQVPLVFERAIAIQENNPVAWQGIITYYEKNLDDYNSHNQLILAYCKLLEICSGPEFTCILNKISTFFSQHGDTCTLNQGIERLSEVRLKLDDDKVKLLDKSLGWILVDNYYNVDECQELMESVFMNVINDTDSVSLQKWYTKYLKILYDMGKTAVLFKTAISIHERFPQDVLPLEYICRVYCEQDMLSDDFPNVDIVEYYESLLNLVAKSEIAIITKAVYLKKKDNLLEARQILNDILLTNSSSSYAWIMLSKLSARLYCWNDAESAAKRALEFEEELSDETLYQVQLILLESLSKSDNKEKWKTAFEKCQRLKPSTQLELICARVSILLNHPNVNTILKNLESRTETKTQAIILRALDLRQHKIFDEAVNILASALETSEAWFLLGMLYWDLAEYAYGLMAFLNGIKTDRYNWQCLVYLGHFYSKHSNEMERSRRCYQSALQINPSSEEAGIGLITAFRYFKNQDACLKLLQTLTMQDNGPKWAWLQLGLQYLDQGDASQAIKAFQHVIRADPNDSHSWEALGDAYFIRGAHTSAVKSYQRSLELCPESLYSMIQLGNIKLIIGHYNEAKKDFEDILVKNSRYVPALKGFAQTCLALANTYTNKQILGRATNYLQLAMDSLTIAVKERTNICCLWKLLGDVCYKTAMLPEKYRHIKVSSILIKPGNVEHALLLNRQDMFSLCTRCYCYALSISPQSALLWHDLASCYLLQLQLNPMVDHKNLASKCLAAAKHAVKLSPSVWLHWNLLGVICMSPYVKNYALAQHAFVMAIDKELNNAVIWSNLGTLYLYIGHIYKANEAYSQAQSANPAYMNSWVGQALIAETMKRKEAMDLFRHSTQLGYHDQAAVGYANYVLKVILDFSANKNDFDKYIIENMYAIFVATDVLTWYIEHHPNDCYARNTLGLLLERQKLYKSAAEQFTAALYSCNEVEQDLIYINLARVLIRCQRYNEGIKLCKAIKNPNYNSQSHLALAFFKATQYEESYTVYETTLHMMANSEDEKAYTLCAMAAIAYSVERVHDAKTLLFQCIQIQPPIAIGLLAAASLGILHGDINLTELVLKELAVYKNDPEYGHHIVNLSAYLHIIGNNIKGAVTTLSKEIFTHPNDIKYWMRLLTILLGTDLQIFNRCAEKVLCLSKNTVDINIAHVAYALSFNCCMHNSAPESLRTLQKLTFTYPGNIESWAILIAAFLSRSMSKTYNIDKKWLSTLASVIQQNFESTNSMTKWLNECKQKLILRT